MASPLGNLPHFTSLDLRGTWDAGVACVVCVYACWAVSECAWAAVAVRVCVADVEGLGCVCGAPGNELGAEGASALADPLGKLVHLTRLHLGGTWHSGVGFVSRVRVCMHVVLSPGVRGRLWQYEAV